MINKPVTKDLTLRTLNSGKDGDIFKFPTVTGLQMVIGKRARSIIVAGQIYGANKSARVTIMSRSSFVSEDIKTITRAALGVRNYLEQGLNPNDIKRTVRLDALLKASQGGTLSIDKGDKAEPAKVLTVEEMIREYFECSTMKDRTKENLGVKFNHHFSVWYEIKTGDLTPEMVKQLYVDAKDKKNAHGGDLRPTLGRAMEDLHIVFKWAKKAKLIQHDNPMAIIPDTFGWPASGTGGRALEPCEYGPICKKLVNDMKTKLKAEAGPRHPNVPRRGLPVAELLWVHVLKIGRISETSNCVWSDHDTVGLPLKTSLKNYPTFAVDMENRVFLPIDNKTNTMTTLPITDAMFPVLERLHKVRKSGWVFEGFRKGQPISYQTIAAYTADLAPGLTTHEFRNTGITEMTSAGFDGDLVRNATLHAAKDTHGKYVKKNVRKIANILDSWAVMIQAAMDGDYQDAPKAVVMTKGKVENLAGLIACGSAEHALYALREMLPESLRAHVKIPRNLLKEVG